MLVLHLAIRVSQKGIDLPIRLIPKTVRALGGEKTSAAALALLGPHLRAQAKSRQSFRKPPQKMQPLLLT
jgi:hypothetical protein